MAGNFRGRKLVVAFPGDFKRQSAFGTALLDADIDTRHPQSAPAYPGKTVTREQIRDCSGEYLIREDITSRLARLSFSFDADARLIAGWMAYAQGVSAAPAGTQTAEVWTLSVVGGPLTAGSFTFTHTQMGITDVITVPYNATQAEIQSLINEMRTIKKGQITVNGSLPLGPVTFTGAGKFAAGDLVIPVINSAGLVGGTVAITTTTPGTGKTAAVTRTSLDQTPPLSIIVGFEDDATDPEKYQDMVVDSVTIRGALRGKVTVDLTLIGSADTMAAVDYVMPECVNIEPIYTRDCRVVIDGDFIIDDLREFTYTFSNSIFSGEDAFPYDDIDVKRLEHGDRTSSFTFSVYGSRGDSLFTKAEDEVIVPVRLLLGPPAQRVEINAPKTSLRLDDAPITFAGEAGRSAIGFTGIPFYDRLTAGTPDNVIYTGPETGQLILP